VERRVRLRQKMKKSFVQIAISRQISGITENPIPDPSLKITIIAYITMANVQANNKFTHKTKQLKKIEFFHEINFMKKKLR